jgi:hypothetical protein
MGKSKIEKIVKTKLSFDVWCKENRWTTTKLSLEFEKYGVSVSPTTIWYWQKGTYNPRDEKSIQVLSEICGFDASTFFDILK